jgi:GrpB-like predicted nucleotidyltransferase (UPF0157 family)
VSATERPRLERVDATWAAAAASWTTRLQRALGDALDGGYLLDVAHVGSTAVPGILAKPTLDLMARVHPWPLPADGDARLAELGFVSHGEHGLPGRSYHTLRRHAVHLHVVGSEGGHWHRHVALRDHLRFSQTARARYEAAKHAAIALAAAIPDGPTGRAAYQEAKAGVLADLEAEAIRSAIARTGFSPIVNLARALADAPARWAIAGGWALDLIAGGWALDLVAGAPTRHHDDVDLAVDAAAAPDLLDTLADQGAQVAWVTGGRYVARRSGEAPPGGAHQAHARWGEVWVDVVLEPWADATWRYRRDPTVTLPLERAVRRVPLGGAVVPVMAPEAVLLFKATTRDRRAPRPKDEADLLHVLPALDEEARAWLRAALPADHPWRERVAQAD